MTATRLRLILLIGLVLLLTSCGAGAWWAQQVLSQKATEADHAKIDAQISQQQIDELKKLKGEIDKQKEVVARASQIAATAQQYQYQDQVISDIDAYAARHKLTVAAYDFTASSGSSAKAPQGTTLTTFAVTLQGSIPYNVFMAFLRDVENNLTKIQVTTLALSPDPKNPQVISNPTITSVVYLKK